MKTENRKRLDDLMPRKPEGVRGGRLSFHSGSFDLFSSGTARATKKTYLDSKHVEILFIG